MKKLKKHILGIGSNPFDVNVKGIYVDILMSLILTEILLMQAGLIGVIMKVIQTTLDQQTLPLELLKMQSHYLCHQVNLRLGKISF